MRFAIVRQDGETDKVDGASVDDVANRFGWPGNGTIEPWDDGKHSDDLRYTFASPDEQREKLADKPTAASRRADKAEAKFTAGPNDVDETGRSSEGVV